MTDRDRLIELFNAIEKDPAVTCPHYKTDKTCDTCKYTINDFMCNHTERTVDYLLANGVIVPPCKFGDTIFVIPSKVNYELNILHNKKQNNRVYEQVIDHIIIWKDDYMLYTCDGLGAVRSKSYKVTWFLTREEAEEKLKELNDNG